jgi:hypothetical protein
MGIPDRNYMEKLGFGQRWRDIMTLIWSTTSSCILLNRKVGRLIKHVQVLRLGDPLLPILFISQWTLCISYWTRQHKWVFYIQSGLMIWSYS